MKSRLVKPFTLSIITALIGASLHTIPAAAQDRDLPTSGYGQHEIMYHWNHLDWNFADPAMEQEFDEQQHWKQALPAGIKTDQAGNTYVSVPRRAEGIPATMNKIVMEDGKPLLEAFPDWNWNEEGNPNALQHVLGYEIDEQNRMWMLDQGHLNGAPSQDGAQKIVIWDLTKDKLVDSIPIPHEIAPYDTSMLNDLVVDNKNGYVYISDSGNTVQGTVRAGIIIYNIDTGEFRRVLDRHESTQPYPGFEFSIAGHPVQEDRPVQTGVDGIALSDDRSTLYYSPLTGRNLYSIPTSVLQDFQLPQEDIAGKVRPIGSKGSNSDGIYADNQGNIWYTMLEGQGIGYYDTDTRTFQDFVTDDRMLWVDGLFIDQKGSVIFNSNRLHQMFGTPEKIDWNNPYNLIVWKVDIGDGLRSYAYSK
ncbi:major royal jelly family protein [Neobacillus mesonae]|nr:major royal jelly family protein [Neobacillus mesonae]